MTAPEGVMSLCVEVNLASLREQSISRKEMKSILQRKI